MHIANHGLISLSAVVGILLVSPSAVHAQHEVGTSGYFRIGQGFSGNAEERACFQAPNADWKFRLGNECDTWLEGGVHDVYKPSGDEGPYIKALVWFGISLAEGRFRQIRFAAPTQAYIDISNIEALGKGTVLWAGRKYYQRHDIHINDFYWSEMLSDGFGVENIDVGFGKLMYAFTRNHDSAVIGTSGDGQDLSAEAFQNNHDLRLVDMPVSISGKGGLTLQLLFAHSGGNERVVNAMGQSPVSTQGFTLGAWHVEDSDILWNKVSVQYGRGITRNKFRAWNSDVAATLTSDAADDLLSADILRITEQFLYKPMQQFALFGAFVYQAENGGDYDDRDLTWYAAALRPMYFVNENMRILGEVSWDRTENLDPADELEGNLVKFTLASELALDYGFWTRPVLRAFVTWAGWSDSFKGRVGTSGQGDPTDCSTKTLCYSAGVQAEYWW